MPLHPRPRSTRRPSLALAWLATLAVLVTSCSVGGATTTGADLDDDLLSRLEVSPPEDIDWRRTVAGVEVAGSGTRPDAAELELIGLALAELPDRLADAAGVGTIYRIRHGDEAEPGMLAFTRGTDVYLIDATFEREPGILELARILAHEYVHAAQFRRLGNDDVAAVIDQSHPDPIATSGFVSDFAETVGWRASTTGATTTWVLDDPGGTTPYGATGPAEDMAESVAAVVMGATHEISEVRERWVVDWLAAPIDELARYKPWLPDGAEEVAPTSPLYDETAATRRGATHTEPHTYLLPADVPAAGDLAATITAVLGRRGLAGELGTIADPRLTRYGGFFTHPAGGGYWVELWDFREAPGLENPPDRPALTYVLVR